MVQLADSPADTPDSPALQQAESELQTGVQEHVASSTPLPTEGTADRVNLEAATTAATEPVEELSAEQRADRLAAAESLKQQGNGLYKAQQYEEAVGAYEEAIDCSPPGAAERAVYYANLAACQMKLSRFREAAENCTAALEVDPKYTKALMRRSMAFKELDDLDHALADAQEILKLEPTNQWATDTVAELQPEVSKRQEAMKTELFGKLKDLGNSILGKFGMSLDNFKADKDPNTGSYNIRFER